MDLLINDYVTAVFIFLGAILYSSVGHGGASSYIAIMSLMGTPINIIKPIGLILNIIVSSVGSFRFIRHKFFNFKVFLPVAIASVPAAFLGGYLELTASIYRPLVGCMLLVAGFQFIFNILDQLKPSKAEINWVVALMLGAVIGLLSGLTGTGGGIFLSPLIVFFGWTSIKEASGTASAFIFFNSLSGLMGNIASIQELPTTVLLFSCAALLGVIIGTQLGIKHLNVGGLKKVLGCVLILAGLKFIIT